MSKVSIFAKLVAAPGKRDEVRAELAKMFPTVADEPGTEVYVLHDDLGDENALWMYELYTDDDALGAHSSSEAMGALFGAIGDLLGEPPLLVMARPVEAEGLDIGA